MPNENPENTTKPLFDLDPYNKENQELIDKVYETFDSLLEGNPDSFTKYFECECKTLEELKEMLGVAILYTTHPASLLLQKLGLFGDQYNNQIIFKNLLPNYPHFKGEEEIKIKKDFNYIDKDLEDKEEIGEFIALFAKDYKIVNYTRGRKLRDVFSIETESGLVNIAIGNYGSIFRISSSLEGYTGEKPFQDVLEYFKKDIFKPFYLLQSISALVPKDINRIINEDISFRNFFERFLIGNPNTIKNFADFNYCNLIDKFDAELYSLEELGLVNNVKNLKYPVISFETSRDFLFLFTNDFRKLLDKFPSNIINFSKESSPYYNKKGELSKCLEGPFNKKRLREYHNSIINGYRKYNAKKDSKDFFPPEGFKPMFVEKSGNFSLSVKETELGLIVSIDLNKKILKEHLERLIEREKKSLTTLQENLVETNDKITSQTKGLNDLEEKHNRY